MSDALRFLQWLILAPALSACSVTSFIYTGALSESPPEVTEEKFLQLQKPYIVDGVIYAQVSLANGNKVYGGDFMGLRKPVTSCYRKTDLAAAVEAFCAQVPYTLHAIVGDGQGGYYVGGERSNLFHIDSMGRILPWRPRLTYQGRNATVTSLKLHNGTLYVGGVFSSVDGESRFGLAAFDTATGNLTSWNPGLDPYPMDYEADPMLVVDMVVAGTQIFVLGQFAGGGQNNVPSGNLISMNLADDNADPNFVLDPSGVFSYTNKIIYARGVLLFGNVMINPADASYIDSEIGNNLGGSAIFYDFDREGDTLWVVGEFDSADGISTTNIAAYDLSGMDLTTPPTVKNWSNGAAAPDGAISSIHVAGGAMLVRGIFANIGATSIEKIAFLKTSDGTLASEQWTPETDTDNLVAGGKADDGSLFLLGSYENMIVRPNIFMVDAANTLTSWDPGTDGSVHAMVTDGTNVFIGGYFDIVGKNLATRENLAAIDANGNATAWNPSPNRRVHSLQYANGFIYAGGEFTSIGGSALPALAKIDASTGAAQSLVGTGVLDNTSEVFTLGLAGDKLIVGGYAVSTTLFAYDLTTSTVVAGWNPNPDNLVKKILVTDDDQILVAGPFTQVDGVARNGLAKLTLSSSTPTAWAPDLMAALLDGAFLVDKALLLQGRTMSPSEIPFVQGVDIDTGAIIYLEPVIDATGEVPS